MALLSSDYGVVNSTPTRQPAVIDVPDVFNYGPFGTPYTLYVYYAGYTTPYRTIEYGPSSAWMSIVAYYTPCT
ncbi:hypothetical protein TUZN_1250 [Thermoproteus uzoniensis 768-20]|uniref:Uncharacterized protein n=1 Tax=Thermoproteus uzoniensis (strain 768-20) TaxID=999630 RepID=F2L0R2_THEU7|nr:hypothetical protein [Thermoproteus uzoniensis]AEA12727.1 hypothetical protein TUZN_1250 [Thermoproteus uzoniensis 768-20]